MIEVLEQLFYISGMIVGGYILVAAIFSVFYCCTLFYERNILKKYDPKGTYGICFFLGLIWILIIYGYVFIKIKKMFECIDKRSI